MRCSFSFKFGNDILPILYIGSHLLSIRGTPLAPSFHMSTNCSRPSRMKCFLALDLPISSTVTSSFVLGLTPFSTPHTGFSFTGTGSPAHPRNHVGYMISTCTYRQSRRVRTKKWCECQRSKEMNLFCNHRECFPSSARRAASTAMGSAPILRQERGLYRDGERSPSSTKKAASTAMGSTPHLPPGGRPPQGWGALSIPKHKQVERFGSYQLE
jgi:hypothetical protein